jgi:PAS domain S-box-containing protein
MGNPSTAPAPSPETRSVEESRLRALLDGVPVGVLEYELRPDNSLVLTDFNRAAERRLSFSCRDMLGRPIEEQFPALPDPAIFGAIRHVARGGERYRNESIRYAQDGIEWEFDVSTFQSRPGRVAVVFRDVTELRRSARELKVSEAKFAAAFHGGVDYMGISRVDDGTFIDVNAAFERSTGWTRAEVVGRSALDLGLWADPAQRAGAVEQIRREGFLRDFPITLRRKDGAVMDCLITSYIVQIGGEQCAVSVVRDMTQAWARERALEESEARFSAFFQSSPVAMVVSTVSEAYRAIDVNEAWTRQFGYPRDAVIGRNGIELGLWESDADRDHVIATIERHGEMRALEVAMRHAEGRRVLCLVSGRAVRVGEGKLLILVMEDITHKKAIEQQLKHLNQTLEARVHERTAALEAAQAELVQSEKLAALGALVAGVSHELNTPIGNSVMVASALQDSAATFAARAVEGLRRSDLERFVEDARNAGDILVRNLQRAAELIASFKQVAVDRTSSQRRRFRLHEVVNETLLTLQPILRRKPWRVTTDLPADLAMDSFPGPLGQVVTNLVQNALLHAFEGRSAGTVHIAARRIGEGEAELSVQDDGIGIPEEHQGRIFDPFFTTKLGQGGSGLGLNIVHNIVTGTLGGRLAVESTLGRGTTVALRMPLQAPAVEPD